MYCTLATWQHLSYIAFGWWGWYVNICRPSTNETCCCVWVWCLVKCSNKWNSSNICQQDQGLVIVSGECRNSLPWPTNKRRDSTGGSHNPGKCTACCCMSGCKFETTHGFADHNISLNSQNHKRPQRHLTCWEKQKIAMRAFKSCKLLYQLRAQTYKPMWPNKRNRLP